MIFKPKANQRPKGLTLIELLIVALMIAILTTVATLTVTTMTTRAKIAATFGTIRAMEIAAEVYEIDLGEYPPSSTSLVFGITSATVPGTGNGNYTQAIVHSSSGTAAAPGSLQWNGPYLDVETRNLGTTDSFEFWSLIGLGVPFSVESASTLQIVDAWGNPIRFLRYGVGTGDTSEYDAFGGTQFPPGSPFATTESYYNFGRFQIVSLGPNQTSLGVPYVGLEADDITNLGGGL